LTTAPKIAINTTGTDLSATTMTIGSDAKTWTYDYSVPSGSDGLATITLSYGADAVPNVMNSDSSHTFVIDTTDPTMSISSPTTDLVVHDTGGVIPFAFTAGDTNLDTCAYEVGTGGFTDLPSCTSPQNITLADGRQTVILRATDLAGNVATDSVNFVVDTGGVLTVDDTPANNPDFATIQGAIDAAVSGITTIDVATGTYSAINVDKSLIIKGANAGIDPNTGTRTTESTIGSGSGNIVTINSDNVVIDGFTITNYGGNSGVGIYSSDKSNLTIKNNRISNIGSALDDKVGRGIEIVSSLGATTDVNGVTIENNKISAITSGLRTGTASKSASGISIGWNAGTKDITNLIIQNNVISAINADTSPWLSTKGQGAYGILINHGTSGGKTVDAQITGNTISNLEGLWAHGIGLEGDTPNASITGNTISNLIDHKGGIDAIGVYAEDNPNAGTVNVHNNKFTNMAIGVALNPGTATGVMDATNNWWGDATGPFSASSNPAGTGVAVAPAINDGFSNYVKFSPFYNNIAMAPTDLVSVDPITSFGLAFGTNPQIVGSNSTLTVTAKDAGGYTVVNDNSTKINLNGDNGASFGANLLTMGVLGTTGTTITNTNTGLVNVSATQVGGTSTGTGTITFTASAPTDTTPPTIISTDPTNTSTGVSSTVSPSITFSEPLDSSTVDSTNIKLYKYSDDSVIPAIVSLVEGGKTVVINPTADLENGTQYYYAVSTGVKDTSGNQFVTAWNSSNKTSHEFTTATIDPIVIDNVAAVRNSATADGKYADGWHYVYDITVNTNETNLSVKFDDWAKTDDPSVTIPANGNMRLLFNTSTGAGLGSSVGTIPETDITNGIGDVKSYEIGNNYSDQKLGGTTQAIDISGLDTNNIKSGKQVQFDVYTKLPLLTPAGFYKTNYGIQIL